MRVDISVLGRFTVRVDDSEVPAALFGGRLTRQLIRVLVARRGSVVTRDALVEDLWAEGPPADPDANLNVLVNRARRALGDPSLIRTVAGGYVLGEDVSLTVDAQRFADGVEMARKRLDHDPAGALASAQDALDLWGEPWADDVDADWARLHRNRLEATAPGVPRIGCDGRTASRQARARPRTSGRRRSPRLPFASRPTFS